MVVVPVAAVQVDVAHVHVVIEAPRVRTQLAELLAAVLPIGAAFQRPLMADRDLLVTDQ